MELALGRNAEGRRWQLVTDWMRPRSMRPFELCPLAGPLPGTLRTRLSHIGMPCPEGCCEGRDRQPY